MHKEDLLAGCLALLLFVVVAAIYVGALGAIIWGAVKLVKFAWVG